ncbi:MAG: carbamoyltransferase HypF [Elusimicrobia bacterium]|nr:carbamoyltransferase HypF [Elusimicrobiota bacterium]
MFRSQVLLTPEPPGIFKKKEAQGGRLPFTRPLLQRIQIRILGIVQGVGFRPFVFNLAQELGLTGWVRNDASGVFIEAEGSGKTLGRFLERLQTDKPPSSFIYAFDHRFLEPAGFKSFEIQKSRTGGRAKAWILPDLAMCPNCRKELFDPKDRRHEYPFINCTHCGPRFTIIESLPYDRPRTTMKMFAMCPDCRKEYENPADRRFHAQPIACPVCGPEIIFWVKEKLDPHRSVAKVMERRRPALSLRERGREAEKGEGEKGKKALELAVQAVREGKIIAVKGLGGYHLIADAANEQAVAILRQRKQRPYKPFAVMYPDLESLGRHVEIPPFAKPLLISTQTPIVLLPRKQKGWTEIAASVAPDSPYLGVFLPYTPLHELLLKNLAFPIVATSGNVTDEPIVYTDQEALKNLASLCDAFLVHNRPVARHADDSVIHVIEQPAPKPQILRRARGYAPMPIVAGRELPPLLALGGHLNATFALSRGKEIIACQHIGDMETLEARQAYEKTLEDFLRLYEHKPAAVAHDMHPDYFTTQLAGRFDLPKIPVNHYHAHLAACMLENQIEGQVIGLTWDGTGFGTDRSIWGGEILLGDAKTFERAASLRPFGLPGGEMAVKEPWRTALSLLWESFGDCLPRDLPLFKKIPEKSIALTLEMIKKGLQCPKATSMGRLFDGLSAILGLSYYNTHQAQSAQLLEYAAWRHGPDAKALEFPIAKQDIIRWDWRPLVRSAVSAFLKGAPLEKLAAAFHASLAETALKTVKELQNPRVVMSGGVFSNRYLTEAMLTKLSKNGFRGYIHSQLPPTDEGLSLGQLWVAAHQV